MSQNTEKCITIVLKGQSYFGIFVDYTASYLLALRPHFIDLNSSGAAAKFDFLIQIHAGIYLARTNRRYYGSIGANVEDIQLHYTVLDVISIATFRSVRCTDL